MKTKQLTTWEAACIITGYGVGGGVMSLPYLANNTGFAPAMIILIAAFAASYILHLMIADLTLKCDEDVQIVSALSKYLFNGKLGKFLTYLFFTLMALILVTNLAAYIAGAEEIIVGLLPVSSIIAKIIFYVVAAAVVMFGLKAIGISEKITVLIIFILVGILAVASFFAPKNSINFFSGSFGGGLKFYGMAMFAMSAFFSVPQAVQGLSRNAKEIKKAVFLGLFNNFVLIIVITFCALMSSKEITEVGMVGWSAGIGIWAQLVGGIFTILAMLTTYWSLSFALGQIVGEQLNFGPRLSWILATLPSLILTLFTTGGFMDFMEIAGGLISIIIAVMVVPAYLNSRKEIPGGILPQKGERTLGYMIIVAYILMGIGSAL